MQLLAKANDLSKKGDIYESEGNYQYASQCYKKVVLILEAIIKNGTEKKAEGQLKDKVGKYRQKAVLMDQKEKEKQAKVESNQSKNKISKLGFPTNLLSNNNTRSSERISFNLFNNNPNEQTVPQNLKLNKTDTVRYKQQSKKYEQHFSHEHQSKNVKVHHQENKIAKQKILQEIPQEIKGLIVNSTVTFDDIAGMESVKKTLEEAVIRPRKRPDLYSGIRAPPMGILLYGPPGNGKTYICKALANQSGCTFFALSASAIMNKLVGETEKMLRNIFQAAHKLSPSIIFIDQIDSILTSRSENENESSRRLKTEFLVLLDGVNSPKGGQILVIGATNLPKQLDLAAKRRFNKLIYVGMPEKDTREQIILKNLEQVPNKLSKSELKTVIKKLQGYSASEITNIIKEVCMIPLRQISIKDLDTIDKNKIRAIGLKDFEKIISEIKPLLSKEDLLKYGAENDKF